MESCEGAEQTVVCSNNWHFGNNESQKKDFLMDKLRKKCGKVKMGEKISKLPQWKVNEGIGSLCNMAFGNLGKFQGSIGTPQ